MMEDHDQGARGEGAHTGVAGILERIGAMRGWLAAGAPDQAQVVETLGEIEALLREHLGDAADPALTTELDSSVVADVVYGRRVPVLTIRFQSGRIYHYYDVPDTVYRDLMAAASKGQYFNRHIRDRYPFRRDA
jgi:hypothetical protein